MRAAAAAKSRWKFLVCRKVGEAVSGEEGGAREEDRRHLN